MCKRLLSCMAVLCAVLLLAACAPVSEEAPAPATIAEPTEEVAAATPALTVTVTSYANVRAGPGTEHDIRFLLTVDTPVHVVGRNAEGDWLRIEHEGQAGWIFGTLTDIGAEALAALPGASAPPVPVAEPTVAPESAVEPTATTEPMVEPTATPEPVVEPTVAPEPVVEPTATPEPVVEPTATPDPAAAPEPTPTPLPEPAEEPTPEAQTPVPTTATVTGSAVNLRTGPGTEHAIDGWVRAGDQLHVTGRNAAGDWLQVVNPSATGERVWIYAPLTDINAETMQTLTEVTAVEAGSDVSPPPEPTPTPPEPAPATPTPVPAVAPAQPILPADCTQWHTVNPNETRLVQITDWFGLDLAEVARLNGLPADTPLTAGSQICLSGTGQVQVPTPTPGQETPAGSSPDARVYPVHPLSMDIGGSVCALRTNGSAACWKHFEHSPIETPPGVYSQVAVNSHVACALRNDATVHCWGHEGGIIEPPGRYVEIDAGDEHTCGLTPSGRINCWGANYHNQATPPDGTFRSLGLGDIHSCAIRTDDTVTCWGLIDENDEPPNKKFQSISGGANYTCGLLLNGELECWGASTRPVTPPGGTFTSFDTGAYHACAVRSNGEMVCWGYNREGEGSPPPGPWKSVKCGFDRTCGVRIDGTMECWGSGW